MLYMQQLGEPGDIPSHFLLIRGREITSCLLLVVNVLPPHFCGNLYQVVCSVQLQVKGLNQYKRKHDLILTPYLRMMWHSLTLISVIHVC